VRTVSPRNLDSSVFEMMKCHLQYECIYVPSTYIHLYVIDDSTTGALPTGFPSSGVAAARARRRAQLRIGGTGWMRHISCWNLADLF
jgi:hypothetical protein